MCVVRTSQLVFSSVNEQFLISKEFLGKETVSHCITFSVSLKNVVLSFYFFKHGNMRMLDENKVNLVSYFSYG